MNLLVPVGRVLFALLFLVAAPRHFSSEGISHAAELGVPLAAFFVPASGVLMVASSLSLMLGWRAKWGAWGLIAFLIPVTLGMHAFWRVDDPVQHHVQLAMFAKNLSMLGAALLLAHFGSGPFSLEKTTATARA
ncbi:MAG: DoxX family protein [Archangium sp.]